LNAESVANKNRSFSILMAVPLSQPSMTTSLVDYVIVIFEISDQPAKDVTSDPVALPVKLS
jgi:hypothetical protein